MASEREWVAEAVDRIEGAIGEGRLLTLDVEVDGERRIAIAELIPHPARLDIQLLAILIDQDLNEHLHWDVNSRLRLRR